MNASLVTRGHRLLFAVCIAVAADAVHPGIARSSDALGAGITVPVSVGERSDPRTEVDLGKRLFEDPNLSADRTIACASCHQSANLFGDPRAPSTGVHRQFGTRHAPSLLQLAWYTCYFWDCRAGSLEEQVALPFFNPRELGIANENQLIARVGADRQYVRAFERLYSLKASALRLSDIARPIVAYERSLKGTSIALDAYLAGNQLALDLPSRRGLEVFKSRAGCASCHLIAGDTAPLTDGLMHPSALGLRDLKGHLPALAKEIESLSTERRYLRIATDKSVAALGRFVVTLDPHDLGQFRTPTLRDTAHTAPYMHDGSVKSLSEAMDLELYYRGVEVGYPIILSPGERTDLLAFLQSLSVQPAATRLPLSVSSRQPGSPRNPF